jgi:hypothetical protein
MSLSGKYSQDVLVMYGIDHIHLFSIHRYTFLGIFTPKGNVIYSDMS